jgi:hypothetical protein
MKRLFILLLLAGVFSGAYCQGERSAEEALFKRITATDSGFLLKKEVMQISAIVNIIDSVNKKDENYKIEDIERRYKEGEITEEECMGYLKYYKEEQKEKEKIEEYKTENDTIAKYYKRENGNYIFNIQYTFIFDDFFDGSSILVEFSPEGKLLKQAIYYHCYWNFVYGPCGNFNKLGDFFSVEGFTCSMGGIYINDLCIFKEIVPADSLKRIPSGCYSAATDEDTIENKYVSRGCDGIIKKIENDSLIISYIPKTYIFGEGDDPEETIEKEPIDVLYIYENNQWHVASEENFEKLVNTTCFAFLF